MSDPVKTLARALFEGGPVFSAPWSEYEAQARALLAEITPQIVAEAVAVERAACTEELRLAVDAARADECGKVQDPVSVHANMLRGTIAKPTVAHIIHLYGRDVLTRELDAQKMADLKREFPNV